MIIRANPAGLLPFYSKLEYQNRFLCCRGCNDGILSHNEFLTPFQIEITGQFNIQTFQASLVSICDGQSLNVDESEFQLVSGNGKSWIIWNGSLTSLNLEECDRVYWFLLINGTPYYSEVMRILPEKYQKYKLEFWSDCDEKNGHYFGGGWKHSIYLDAFSDTPSIVRSEDVSTNGDGDEKVNFSRVEEWCIIEVCDILDSQLNAFHLIRDADHIQITNSEGQQIIGMSYDFSSTQDAVQCKNIGRMRLMIDVNTDNHCCDTDQITYTEINL